MYGLQELLPDLCYFSPFSFLVQGSIEFLINSVQMKKKKITTATSTNIPAYSRKEVYCIRTAIFSRASFDAGYPVEHSLCTSFPRTAAKIPGQQKHSDKPPD